MIGIVYYLLREGTEYQDLGGHYFAQLDQTRIERQHVHRLEQLGYTVTLTPAQAA